MVAELLCNGLRVAVPFRPGKAAPRPLHAGCRTSVRCQAAPDQQRQQQQEQQGQQGLGRRQVLGGALSLAAASTLQQALPLPALANRLLSPEWEVVDLPVEKGVVLLDIGFTGTDPNHGFLLGTRQTLLETFDGGKTWAPRSVAAAQDEGFNFRFNSISFKGDEGWIVGKPAILLHTTDGGANWERIPLSAKLPGTPAMITALDGSGAAEMTTDQGAIYVTSNGALNWRAAVQETVDATLNRVISSGISGASYYEGSFSNIARGAAGDYVAVSSRGNFFMTWVPGDTFWQPHNRPTARRVQNMGFTPDGSVWLTTKAGDLYYSNGKDNVEQFAKTSLKSRGFGILDVGFASNNVGFACGGSGSLYKTEDGGKSWKRDRTTDDLAANLYEIKFVAPGTGFILGNDGVLLRYVAPSA
ncbi:hypothetical protein N2152v2_010072 [Parachlorella kessleri]